jgi:Mg2+ and Co2+ transporter CorA
MSDHSLRACLESSFGTPHCLWTTLCQRSNGYFGCENICDATGTMKGHNTWFRFQIKQLSHVRADYVWHDFTFFTTWKPLGIHTVLCFDVHPIFQDQIQKALNARLPGQDADIYLLHTALTSVILELYDHSVWTIRDRVRDIEKQRMSRPRSDTDYPMLHEIARHACHSSETLLVSVETLNSMRSQYESFLDSRSAKVPIASSRLRQFLDFQLSMFKSLHARSLAVEARLSNELNLAINMVAQQESAATVRISKAAQSDGAAMKAVAVVTLLFLPSTFVSTIFSMTFFSFSPDSDGHSGTWAVSDEIWLYWLFTVPLTILAMGSWIWWQRGHRPSEIS